MEEYIQLMADKARRNDFPAIVHNDASTSNEEVSFEPTDLQNENDDVGGVFINLEISKCWSLEISKRLFNTFLLMDIQLSTLWVPAYSDYTPSWISPLLYLASIECDIVNTTQRHIDSSTSRESTPTTFVQPILLRTFGENNLNDSASFRLGLTWL
ncbi:hypothetical protein Tco_0647433 [Tanacetum coccineum]